MIDKSNPDDHAKFKSAIGLSVRVPNGWVQVLLLIQYMVELPVPFLRGVTLFGMRGRSTFSNLRGKSCLRFMYAL